MIILGGINSTYGAVATDGVQDYVWIPRFGYQKDSKEKQFVRELSHISTYNQGLGEDYIVPNEFGEKTGIWQLESELEDLTTITITYDKNCTDEVINLPSEIVVEPGMQITISTQIPERAKYLFKGWNTKADGTGTTYQPGDKITTTSDVILYAIWDYKYVTITYDKNCTEEVSNIPSDIVVEKGIETEISTAIPEREGYIFKYWCTGANGSGTIYQPGDKRIISKDITLYAIWKEAVMVKLRLNNRSYELTNDRINNIDYFIVNFTNERPSSYDSEDSHRLIYESDYSLKISTLLEYDETFKESQWGGKGCYIWGETFPDDIDFDDYTFCVVEIHYKWWGDDYNYFINSYETTDISLGNDEWIDTAHISRIIRYYIWI